MYTLTARSSLQMMRRTRNDDGKGKKMPHHCKSRGANHFRRDSPSLYNNYIFSFHKLQLSTTTPKMAADNMTQQNAAAPVEQQQETSGFFSSFVSYFVPTAHADDSEEEEKEEPAEEEEEEEEEDPEDIAPAIREECEKNACAEHVHHFAHCQEKVEAGEGFPGEDCVEEFFHILHCVDACAAPKIFKKLA
ncbi:hypothetical protein CNBF1240 [Cryptococcus deneoformans B-3501A]|uniref:hypothetical protein n=1 Tax=Cryptococcus deneoformans (strain B-3501A) TaxID=283643 RepID=UPI000042DA8A|nr:hypothetical protein CNBF1240 [Cryptococcus neoformans var. neoformans B-3501A]EAL20313.1 hypothetical protein CNBF1240 [Cryptococcus neoformans var. neoformans B-3501A]